MRTIYFLFLFLILTIAFISCKEEEDLNPNYTFSCIIDGSDFNTTETNIEHLSDNLSIIATNHSYTITIKIEDINTRSAGEVIEFDKVNLGMVNTNNLVYSNTTFDPSKGNITITSLDLTAGEVSGTFFFEAKEVVPPYLDIIQVSTGIFSNISF